MSRSSSTPPAAAAPAASPTSSDTAPPSPPEPKEPAPTAARKQAESTPAEAPPADPPPPPEPRRRAPPTEVYVRLRPYDPDRGITKQRHHVMGETYEVSKGWYVKPVELAERLVDLRYDPTDDSSPRIFQIVGTKEEAAELDAQEHAKGTAENPIRQEAARRAATRTTTVG